MCSQTESCKWQHGFKYSAPAWLPLRLHLAICTFKAEHRPVRPTSCCQRQATRCGAMSCGIESDVWDRRPCSAQKLKLYDSDCAQPSNTILSICEHSWHCVGSMCPSTLCRSAVMQHKPFIALSAPYWKYTQPSLPVANSGCNRTQKCKLTAPAARR